MHCRFEFAHTVVQEISVAVARYQQTLPSWYPPLLAQGTGVGVGVGVGVAVGVKVTVGVAVGKATGVVNVFLQISKSFKSTLVSLLKSAFLVAGLSSPKNSFLQ